jgi:predicted transcriptional regulator
MAERFNIQLDDARASKLRELAERTHVNPGTIARSLLSQALDDADPTPASVVALLDSIPGALDKAREGVRQVRSGKGIPLDEL